MKKPQLSFWQIWNMSFGFLGIQFGFALQNANVSRIFQTLGAEIEQIPILWIAAPLTGLVIQPIIGYFSDRTWNRLGRRRPYFLIGAILASIALFIMPNSPTFWIAAGMLWIMDASINVSMEPFRAFVGDNLSSEQRTMGFAMQSFFIGIGAVIASMLPYVLSNWFGVSNTAPEGIIPDSVKWSFYFGGAIFFVTVLWTVIRSKEYSPEEMAQFDEGVEDHSFRQEAQSREDYMQNGLRQFLTGIFLVIFALLFSFWVQKSGLDNQLYILSGMTAFVGLLMIVSGTLQRIGKYKSSLVIIINDFQMMPKTMRQLSIVQFFSWFALFSMWIYMTAAVTNHLYGTTDTTSQAYSEGAEWVGVCFAIYNGVAALIAFLLPNLAKKTSRKTTHLICLILGGLGLISVFYVTNPDFLIISMIGVGIAWASILSIPYAILTGSLPSDKMGYYMGIFNFFIVIPQLVAASILGFLIGKFFGGDAVWAMVLGGVSMILAGVLTLLVDDEDDVVSA